MTPKDLSWRKNTSGAKCRCPSDLFLRVRTRTFSSSLYRIDPCSPVHGREVLLRGECPSQTLQSRGTTQGFFSNTLPLCSCGWLKLPCHCHSRRQVRSRTLLTSIRHTPIQRDDNDDPQQHNGVKAQLSRCLDRAVSGLPFRLCGVCAARVLPLERERDSQKRG